MKIEELQQHKLRISSFLKKRCANRVTCYTVVAAALAYLSDENYLVQLVKDL